MKFEVQQRAHVPGTAAQGVIVDATETVTGFPVYVLRWLDESGQTHTGTVGEGDLAAANLSVDDLRRLADDQAETEKEIDAIINREVRLRLRRKSAKKSASKRKR